MSTRPSLEVRIAQHLAPDGSAIIPPRVARWLENTCKLTADRRILLRDTDPDAYIALTALHLAALHSDNGTNHARAQHDSEQSNTWGGWMSTSQAAEALGVTDRCIRNWCNTGRLHARLVGGRWLVNPTSIALRNTA